MVNSGSIGPYRPDGGSYECLVCGHRVTGPVPLGACPRCGGQLRNIALPRE